MSDEMKRAGDVKPTDEELRRASKALKSLASDDAGEPSTEEERRLILLAQDIRNLRPRPHPDFRRRMHGQVAAGFRPEEPARRRLRVRAAGAWRGLGVLASWRVALPAVAGAAAVAVAVVFSVNFLLDGTGKESPVGPTAVKPAAPLIAESGGREPDRPGGSQGDALREKGVAGGSGGAEAPRAMPDDGGSSDILPPEPSGDDVPGVEDRKVVASASMALETESDRVQKVADDVARTVDRLGGIVLSSNVTSDTGFADGAFFELSVPKDRLSATMAGLAKLATVTSRTQTTQDITGQFVSAEDALDDLRAERRGLRRSLAHARTKRERDSIKENLKTVNMQIEARKAEVEQLQQTTDNARLNVTLSAKTDSPTGNPSDGLGGAFGDALSDLESIAAFFVRALAVLVPLAIAALAIWLAVRAALRRRRHAR